MRSVLPLAILLVAAAAPREGCGNGRGTPLYDPCAGKACGDACTACAPGATDCMETAVVKACDPSGRCVSKVDGMCAPLTECAGRPCGAQCSYPDLPCLHSTPRCLPPQSPGHCDANGACAQGYPPPPGACAPPPVSSCQGQACGVRCEIPCPIGYPCGATPPGSVCDGLGHCLSPWSGGPPPPPECYQPPPSWGCVGKACGDSCGVCPPGTDPARCPVPTFAATACDTGLQCVTVGTFSCSPESACRGKACGAACEIAPGRASPYAMACGYSGRCVPVTSWLCYEPCAGKTCGERCQVCPPGATDCEEPRSVNACDPNGVCTADTGKLCGP